MTVAEPASPAPAGGAVPTALTRRALAVVPGLAVVAVGAATATVMGRTTSVVSPLAACLVLGVAVGRAGRLATAAGPGLRLARGTLLRLGVALLGFRLAVGSVAEVGLLPLASLVAVSATTFVVVRAAAGKLGLGEGLAALVGAGFAICGASAVAATATVVDADDDDIAFAAGLATLFGTVSLFVLPVLARSLDLAPDQVGFWSGASVNDVGQAVAAAAAGGADGLETGVVAKLARVLLLAPLLLVVRADVRRRAGATASGSGGASVVPWFVVAFLAAGAVRSTGLVPDVLLVGARWGEALLLGVGLVGVGAAVDLGAVRRAGTRPLVLGVCAWATVVGSGLAATTLVSH